jgi:shikimate kinase
MNLVLIGYRGTGKSTIGKMLSQKLRLAYTSLDEEIVRRAEMSIPALVEQYSWEYFRDLEEKVVQASAAQDGQVIDTGGGVVTRWVNIQRLQETGVIFLLEASVEDMIARIGLDNDRPSLTGTRSATEEVVDVWREREPLYRKAARFTVNTSELNPEQAADRIVNQFLLLTSD